MAQDTLQASKEAYKDAQDEMRDTHARIVEDLKFSNPADPQQWPTDMLTARKGRPNYTFDRTNQFIQQVVNDARQNKPSISCMPADSQADPEVAEIFDGMIRHIEYVSRAGIAYDTAIELAARGGLGWLRVVPQVMRPETNEQEIRILRVHDPLSCLLEAGWTQPDGSDALRGWATTVMSRAAFKRQYPKATDSAAWIDEHGIWTRGNGDSIVIAEEFQISEKSCNRLRIISPDGDVSTCSEDEYWQLAKEWGTQPQMIEQFQGIERSQKWRKMTGAEILEETDFPSQFLPVIPVLGFELWVEGKRHLCGLTRRLMDGQRLHNYEMSAWAETMALQPKAPFITPAEAIAGYETHWQQLNSGNPSFLPYNALREDGTPIPPPARLAPPAMPAAFAQGAVMASQEMEASVGMFKANLGQQGNETSGKAINARKVEGDIATFHFVDNLSRSIEQLGRVVVDMIPRIYDTQRRARVLGMTGQQSFVTIKPDMEGTAVQKDEAGEVTHINPNVGAYDVRVKAGPSYTTQRQEVSQQLTEMIRGNPAMMAALGPMWARMQDFPESDELAKHLLAIAPPQIQALEQGKKNVDPQTMAQMQQMQQQIQQLTQMLQQATQEADKAQIEKDKVEAQILVDGYEAITGRLTAIKDSPLLMQLLFPQLANQAMQTPPIDPHELAEVGTETPDPPGQPDDAMQPPTGGFFTPEQFPQQPA